jgi:hypothetical protein
LIPIRHLFLAFSSSLSPFRRCILSRHPENTEPTQ